MTIFKRPMLACALLPSDIEHTNDNILRAMERLKYPVIATLKKDGIRAVKTDDLKSRTLNLIPNVSIRRRAMVIPAGFDMELWSPDLQYDEIESIVMSEEHEKSDKIGFHFIDNWKANNGIYNHYGYASRISSGWHLKGYMLLPVVYPNLQLCNNAIELMTYFLRCEKENGEGICFRTLDSPYKQGRSTLKEQYLVKLSRYVRSEWTVYGFEEQQENTNPVKRNAVGRMDRSKTVAGTRGKDTLGSLLIRNKEGLETRVGTGFTDQLRRKIWNDRDCYEGQTVVIKSKPYGVKVKPRSPVFMGFRKEIDL